MEGLTLVTGKWNLHNINTSSNTIKMHQFIKGRCAQLDLFGNTILLPYMVRRNVITFCSGLYDSISCISWYYMYHVLFTRSFNLTNNNIAG